MGETERPIELMGNIAGKVGEAAIKLTLQHYRGWMNHLSLSEAASFRIVGLSPPLDARLVAGVFHSAIRSRPTFNLGMYPGWVGTLQNVSGGWVGCAFVADDLHVIGSALLTTWGEERGQR